MSTKSKGKDEIEGDFGQRISILGLQAFPLYQDVAISTHTRCSITQHPTLTNLPKRCFLRKTLDVSGLEVTGPNGQKVIELTLFICPVDGKFSFPINVVATPISQDPVYVTVQQQIIKNGGDVQITVFAWDASGAPAPKIPFNWRCRVELP